MTEAVAQLRKGLGLLSGMPDDGARLSGGRSADRTRTGAICDEGYAAPEAARRSLARVSFAS